MCIRDRIGIERVDRIVENYYYSYMVAVEFYMLENKTRQSENTHIRVRVNSAIEASIKDLDVDAEGEALHASVKRAAETLKARLSEIDDGDVRGWVDFLSLIHIYRARGPRL